MGWFNFPISYYHNYFHLVYFILIYFVRPFFCFLSVTVCVSFCTFALTYVENFSPVYYFSCPWFFDDFFFFFFVVAERLMKLGSNGF